MPSRYAAVHAADKLAGAGDARPSAQQIINDNDLVGKLTDKVALVTGCSSGLGIETARALKSTGMKVFVTARDEAKARAALGTTLEPGRCELLLLDLSSTHSVEACARTLLARTATLNLFIANAAIMANPTRDLTQDGFEAQFGVCHLGHFLLFQRLKALLLRSASPTFPSRVVCVSSSGHRASGVHFDDLMLAAPGAYTGWVGYGQAKTANIYMANEIERRYGERGIHAFSLHPGGIWTGLQVHMDTERYKRDPEVTKFMKSVEQGAATTVYAALDREMEGRGGLFLEDCDLAVPVDEVTFPQAGYAKHAFDPEAEARLWKMSCEILGLEDDS